jgi:hypothetical protein
MSEYKGWEVAVTPGEEAPMLWRALIEVWPAGKGWRTSRPRRVSFRQSAMIRDEILKAATSTSRNGSTLRVQRVGTTDRGGG